MPESVVPKQSIDLEKAVIHLRRLIETRDIPAVERPEVFEALHKTYEALDDHENAALIGRWAEESKLPGYNREEPGIKLLSTTNTLTRILTSTALVCLPSILLMYFW